MFVIQLESGQTRGFNTADDLRAAIRRGEVGPGSRVYHRTSDRWLPLSVHPVYRSVEAEHMEFAARQLQRRHWTFLPLEPRAEDPQAEEMRGSADLRGQPSSADPEAPTGQKAGWVRSTLRRLRLRSQSTPERT
jgi:hypothetical protein